MMMIIITDLYSAFRSEDTEALQNQLSHQIKTTAAKHNKLALRHVAWCCHLA